MITAEANMKNEEQVSEVSDQRWTDVISWKYQKRIDVEGLDEMRGDAEPEYSMSPVRW